MGSIAAQFSKRIQSGADQIVSALRDAAGAAEKNDIAVAEITETLKTAFSNRNRIDAAVIGAIAMLDKITQQAPDGELTAGLSSVKNGYQVA
jgi:phosphoglycolate phosphatase-like HAD superfamily hydrolase